MMHNLALSETTTADEIVVTSTDPSSDGSQSQQPRACICS